MKHKIILFAAVLLALALSVGAVPAAAASGVTWGDADGNGAVNGRDLLTLRRYLAAYDYVKGVSSVPVSAGADSNGNGTTNAIDLLLLRRYVVGLNYATGLSSVRLGPDSAPSGAVVGISNCGTASKAQIYVDGVVKAGGAAIVFPVFTTEEEVATWLAKVDAVIMTGGGDIDATYYGEENQPYQGDIDAVRDRSDVLLTRAALAADIPLLCVCRGMQILNVVCGGTLYQDLGIEVPESDIIHRDPKKKSFVRHDIEILPGSQIQRILGVTEASVNSWHHQAVKGLGDGLVITATAPDGTVEGIEMPGKTFVLGVQFHPEYHVKNGNMIFLGFFEMLLSRAE